MFDRSGVDVSVRGTRMAIGWDGTDMYIQTTSWLNPRTKKVAFAEDEESYLYPLFVSKFWCF